MGVIDYDLRTIKALLFDVDGVLSANVVSIDIEGVPMRTVNIKDGYALHRAAQLGVNMGIITGGTCESAPAMAADGIHDYVMVQTDGVIENGPSTGSGTFTVYPNPAHGVLYVETRRATSLQDEYRIVNAMGQTVLTGQITDETQRIDVSNLPQGIYFITFEGITKKFVVK